MLSYSSSTTAVVPLLTHEKAGVRFGANISNLSISELKYTKSQAIATAAHPFFIYSLFFILHSLFFFSAMISSRICAAEAAIFGQGRFL